MPEKCEKEAGEIKWKKMEEKLYLNMFLQIVQILVLLHTPYLLKACSCQSSPKKSLKGNLRNTIKQDFSIL
jgi:hypothetical protein